MEPIRLLNLPLLINQRPPSLFCSVHQKCLYGIQKKEIVDKTSKIKVGLTLNEEGKVNMKYLKMAPIEDKRYSNLGKRKREEEEEESKVVALSKFDNKVMETIKMEERAFEC